MRAAEKEEDSQRITGSRIRLSVSTVSQRKTRFSQTRELVVPPWVSRELLSARQDNRRRRRLKADRPSSRLLGRNYQKCIVGGRNCSGNSEEGPQARQGRAPEGRRSSRLSANEKNEAQSRCALKRRDTRARVVRNYLRVIALANYKARGD